MKTSQIYSALLLSLSAFVVNFAQAKTDLKPATEHAVVYQKQVKAELPFSDDKYFELFKQGFIAKLDELGIKDAQGNVV